MVKYLVKGKYEKGNFFAPMLCEEGTVKDLGNSEYAVEPKFDGNLVVAERTERDFRIYSKHGCEYRETMPDIVEPLCKIRAFFRVIAEVIYVDSKGHMIFAGSQKRCQVSKKEMVEKYVKAYPLILQIFDITMLNNENLENMPYVKRREILVHFIELQKALYGLTNIRIVPMSMEREKMYEWCVDNGYEGVVLKHLFAKYESGKRTRAYLKVKLREHTPFTLENLGKIQ